MSEEELTASEQEAYTAMQSEDTEVDEAPQDTEEGTQDASEDTGASSEDGAEEGEQTAEFKSQRDEKPPEGMVPHQAMHAERQKRQAAEARLAEMEAKLSALETPAEKPPEFVDPLEDPDGFRKWQEHQSAETKDQIDAIHKERQESLQRAERVQKAERLEQEFAAKTPDYMDAVKTLHNSRVSALRDAGWDDSEIQSQIVQDAQNVFEAAERIGMNPAQLLYIRAQEFGYTPKAAEAAQETTRGTAEADRITALAEAQKNTQGLGSAGGGEQAGQLTAAQLANMSEAELAKVSDADIARAMGG